METTLVTQKQMGRPMVLTLAVTATAVAVVAFLQWHNHRLFVNQQTEAAQWKQLWQDHTNAVNSAKAREHAQANEGYMTPELIRWKLFYDHGQGRNFIEVRAKNPLAYHRASFCVNFLAQTTEWLGDGRQAARRDVSKSVTFRGLSPTNSGVVYVAFPATVETHAVSWWGKIVDFFRWGGLPVTEPPIDPKTVTVRVFADQAEWVEGMPVTSPGDKPQVAAK